MTIRRRRLIAVLVGLVGLAALGLVAALILTVPPKPVGLASPRPGPSGSVVGGSSPNGVWLANQTREGPSTAFVGYRVHEKLGPDFITWPNEAVGRTRAVNGRLEIRDGILRAAEIEAGLNLLQSDEPDRDTAVANDALSVAQFPTARFRLTEPVAVTGVDPGAATDVQAHGELTIKGVTKPVVWPLRVRWDGDTIEVAGQLPIERLDYGVDMGRFLVLRVADEVTLEAQLQFQRECVSPCSSPGPVGSPDLVAASLTPPQQESPVPVVQTIGGGGEIALMGGTSDRFHIYVVDLATGRLRALTKGGLDELFPFWAAGGDRVGYVRVGSPPASGAEPPPIELVLAGPDGSAPRVIRPPGLFPIEHPSLSPDGKRIAFSVRDEQTGGDIWVTDLAGKATKLTGGPGTEDEPRWSPDGRHIAYTRFAPGSNLEDVWIMDRDGTNQHTITTAAGYEYAPAWAPDGRRIAFVQDGRISVMNADGSAVATLTDGTRDSSPTWSPNGQYLAFIRDSHLLVMGSDGSGLRRVEVPLEVVADPAWRP